VDTPWWDIPLVSTGLSSMVGVARSLVLSMWRDCCDPQTVRCRRWVSVAAPEVGRREFGTGTFYGQAVDRGENL
jgi:hypothetical protein